MKRSPIHLPFLSGRVVSLGDVMRESKSSERSLLLCLPCTVVVRLRIAVRRRLCAYLSKQTINARGSLLFFLRIDLTGVIIDCTATLNQSIKRYLFIFLNKKQNKIWGLYQTMGTPAVDFVSVYLI
jgi:hypothetical protein